MPKTSRKSSKTTPTYDEESSLISDGYSLVAGLDEAGRGPLAGPVVAAAVILPSQLKGKWVSLIRDSKQITPAQREYVLHHLKESALGIQVGVCSPTEIDEINILEATRLAMKRALDSLALLPQFLLLDALALPKVPIPQKSIIRGDALCLSIAAASIVAKVTRDNIMRDEDATHPGYGFARHKGYCTPEHLSNLKRLGPCPIHRYSFAPVKELANNSIQ